MLAVPGINKLLRRLATGFVVFGVFWLGLGVLALVGSGLLSAIPCSGEDCDREIVIPWWALGTGLAMALPGAMVLRALRRATAKALAERDRATHLRRHGQRVLATIVSYGGTRFHTGGGLLGQRHSMHRHRARADPDIGPPFEFEVDALRPSRLLDGHRFWAVYDPAEPGRAVPYEDLDEMPRV